ncbi:CDP-alcohol phosphatidyltransferase [Methanococcoides sp. SA1]|uniref:CDP-alcohol phosphatidyltransferase family protein n=1 Tax=Lentimicrobium sp. L6 TaxID=2735916 RepID=UPI001556984D|nr:CDP-alcohol phosphatidyltransferase family protein [Lentimicrobium sp. L6]NPD84833.1 CDP-alcohol phosphatidyltransferase [Lentimicrobium sp. L6]NPE28843.1 CDP-alcohol phosphatidyltransferase [Methanococcoides sp. SA1]
MDNNKQLSVFSFIKDMPNICSLLGLLSAVIGIYFAIQGNFEAAIIGVLWAVLFDWFDGIIARILKGRTKIQGDFGAQLDSMIDIVSFGILPAIILLSYGEYSIWFLPGAFVIIAASAIRLTYFNVYGLIDTKTYKGFPLDNNVLILALVFVFENFFEPSIFAILIYALLMLFSVLNLSSIPTPKFGGKWVYALVAYVIILTGVFGWLLWV